MKHFLGSSLHRHQPNIRARGNVHLSLGQSYHSAVGRQRPVVSFPLRTRIGHADPFFCRSADRIELEKYHSALHELAEKTRLRWRPSALKIIDPRLLEKQLRRSSRKRYVHHTHHPRAEFMTCFRLGLVLSVRLYCCPSLCMAAIVFAFRRWRFIREENLSSLRIQAQDVCGIRCSNHLLRRSRINVLPEYVKTSVTVRHIQNGFAVRRPLVRAILQFVQRQSLQRAD